MFRYSACASLHKVASSKAPSHQSRSFVSLFGSYKPTHQDTLHHEINLGPVNGFFCSLSKIETKAVGTTLTVVIDVRSELLFSTEDGWVPDRFSSGLQSSPTVCHLALDRSASNLATSFRSWNDTSSFQMHSSTTPMSRIASDTPNMIMGMFGGLGQSVGADEIIFRNCHNEYFTVRRLFQPSPQCRDWTRSTEHWKILLLSCTPISWDGKDLSHWILYSNIFYRNKCWYLLVWWIFPP